MFERDPSSSSKASPRFAIRSKTSSTIKCTAPRVKARRYPPTGGRKRVAWPERVGCQSTLPAVGLQLHHQFVKDMKALVYRGSTPAQPTWADRQGLARLVANGRAAVCKWKGIGDELAERLALAGGQAPVARGLRADHGDAPRPLLSRRDRPRGGEEAVTL